jgi:hypothetical protein
MQPVSNSRNTLAPASDYLRRVARAATPDEVRAIGEEECRRYPAAKQQSKVWADVARYARVMDEALLDFIVERTEYTWVFLNRKYTDESLQSRAAARTLERLEALVGDVGAEPEPEPRRLWSAKEIAGKSLSAFATHNVLGGEDADRLLDLVARTREGATREVAREIAPVVVQIRAAGAERLLRLLELMGDDGRTRRAVASRSSANADVYRKVIEVSRDDTILDIIVGANYDTAYRDPVVRAALLEYGKGKDAHILTRAAPFTEGDEFRRIIGELTRLPHKVVAGVLRHAKPEQLAVLRTEDLEPLLQSGEAEARLAAIGALAHLRAAPALAPAPASALPVSGSPAATLPDALDQGTPPHAPSSAPLGPAPLATGRTPGARRAPAQDGETAAPVQPSTPTQPGARR